MTSCYEELDDDLFAIINNIRREIVYENKDNLFIKRNCFFYKNIDYFLISLIPSMPYVQLLIACRDGQKVGDTKIVVGNIYTTMSIKEAMRESDNIRKYNSKVANPRNKIIPDYQTTLDIEYTRVIENMICLQTQKTNNYRLKYLGSNINYYDEYIKICKEVDAMRKQPKKVHVKRLVKH